MNDTGTHSRPFQFSVMVGISPFGFGFGVVPGIRLDIPILDDGFIPNLNDSLEIEVEVDAAISFGSLFGVLIGIPVFAGVRWTLYFTDSIAGFVRGGGGVVIYPQLFGVLGGAGIGGGGMGGLGVLFNLGGVTLRVETGYPGLLSVGLTF